MCVFNIFFHFECTAIYCLLYSVTVWWISDYHCCINIPPALQWPATWISLHNGTSYLHITLPGWEFYNCSVQILTPSFARHQEILTILVLYHVLLLKLTPESLLQFTCSYRWSFRAFAFPMALTQKSVEIFPQRFSISNQIFIFPSLIIFPFFFTKNLLILCWKSWVFFN